MNLLRRGTNNSLGHDRDSVGSSSLPYLDNRLSQPPPYSTETSVASPHISTDALQYGSDIGSGVGSSSNPGIMKRVTTIFSASSTEGMSDSSAASTAATTAPQSGSRYSKGAGVSSNTVFNKRPKKKISLALRRPKSAGNPYMAASEARCVVEEDDDGEDDDDIRKPVGLGDAVVGLVPEFDLEDMAEAEPSMSESRPRTQSNPSREKPLPEPPRGKMRKKKSTSLLSGFGSGLPADLAASGSTPPPVLKPVRARLIAREATTRETSGFPSPGPFGVGFVKPPLPVPPSLEQFQSSRSPLSSTALSQPNTMNTTNYEQLERNAGRAAVAPVAEELTQDEETDDEEVIRESISEEQDITQNKGKGLATNSMNTGYYSLSSSTRSVESSYSAGPSSSQPLSADTPTLFPVPPDSPTLSHISASTGSSPLFVKIANKGRGSIASPLTPFPIRPSPSDFLRLGHPSSVATLNTNNRSIPSRPQSQVHSDVEVPAHPSLPYLRRFSEPVKTYGNSGSPANGFEPFPLLLLPGEAVSLILSFLDRSEVARIAVTNTMLHTASVVALYERIDLRYIPVANWHKLVRTLRNSESLRDAVEVIYVSSDSALDFPIASLPYLRSLTLPSFQAYYPILRWHTAFGLQHLQLLQSEEGEAEDDLWRWLDGQVNIVRLEILGFSNRPIPDVRALSPPVLELKIDTSDLSLLYDDDEPLPPPSPFLFRSQSPPSTPSYRSSSYLLPASPASPTMREQTVSVNSAPASLYRADIPELNQEKTLLPKIRYLHASPHIIATLAPSRLNTLRSIGMSINRTIYDSPSIVEDIHAVVDALLQITPIMDNTEDLSGSDDEHSASSSPMSRRKSTVGSKKYSLIEDLNVIMGDRVDWRSSEKILSILGMGIGGGSLSEGLFLDSASSWGIKTLRLTVSKDREVLRILTPVISRFSRMNNLVITLEDGPPPTPLSETPSIIVHDDASEAASSTDSRTSPVLHKAHLSTGPNLGSSSMMLPPGINPLIKPIGQQDLAKLARRCPSLRNIQIGDVCWFK